MTGGSRGIGRAVALAFSAEGADVAIVGVRDETALRGVEKKITSQGGRALAIMADVAKRAEIDRLMHTVIESWGRIDILVNNAGVIRMSPLEEIPEDQWDEIISIHLKGTFNGIQAVIPAMKRQQKGKIINVAAPSALRGLSGCADYAAAKGGIVSLTYNAASELKPHNIQVNCISPVADTRMTDALLDYSQAHPEQSAAPAPKKGAVPPEAVAPAFVFFACSDSDFITGQVLATNR